MAAKITYRLFSKYGNPKFVEKELQSFCNSFQTQYSEIILESHLKLLLNRETKFVGSKSLIFAIKYISAATKIDITMKKLKPFVERIMF